MASFLTIRDLVVRFGGVAALNGVSLDMRQGEILGLIGPNGAGKTTLFNCLSRLCTPAAGSIRFRGRDIQKLPASRIARAGIGRTFQNVAAFAGLSVFDNIRVGAHVRVAGNLVGDALRLPGARRGERKAREITEELVDALGLGGVARTPVKALPFATQKRVELARALAAEPQLLLLDEPAGGLSHEEMESLGALLKRIREERTVAMLLVEHHMRFVMSLSDRVAVLSFGEKIADGTPEAVQSDPRVIEAYLGGAQ